MAKEPRPRNEEADDDDQIDPVARETVENLDGYRDYLREQRTDRLTSDEY